MTPMDTLLTCWSNGVRLVLVDGKLRAKGPTEAINDRALDIAEHKDGLLELLARPEIGQKDIDDFEAWGYEVCFECRHLGAERVWLVPERTGQDRLEVTPHDILAFREAKQVFPGATVVQVAREAKSR